MAMFCALSALKQASRRRKCLCLCNFIVVIHAKKSDSAELPISFTCLKNLGMFYWGYGEQDKKIFAYEKNFPTHIQC